MLISRASEANPKERRRERAAERRARSRAHDDYQTANELFEIMAKNHPFDQNARDSLSASDLVLLYKNIEMGTKLMSEASPHPELNRCKPNQHVETVVYHDDTDASDVSDDEIYTSDDLHHAIIVNNERLDLLTNPPSLENTLCHKLGDLEMRSSDISTQYDKYFLFKDPYIKEQLNNLNMLKSSNNIDNAMLPASLLDYICCKRLDDNCNFYMDNVIKYVKHTIEQLKRISNGDYLTDKAKEKWREVEGATETGDKNNAKILATSASFPLQVERKANGHLTTWDDIIHSEVDIRSLTKLLEKKIVVEIPRMLCGSYKLFGKLCSDNLVLCCKNQPQSENADEKDKPRLDVVLQLGRSDSGQVTSNIDSIMIWKTNLPLRQDDSPTTALLPIPYCEPELEAEDQPPKIIEIEDVTEEPAQPLDNVQETFSENNANETHNTPLPSEHEEDNYSYDKDNNTFSESSDSLALKDILETKAVPNVMSEEAKFYISSPDDLSFSIQRSNMNALPEEIYEEIQKPIKRKSPTKVRVKSPYENKSYLIEEKKRKKLLEIRERREKRKMAMSESCKISKHKYGKGPIMPRPSSSVTKLSITNKSFYNSIYGQNAKKLDLQINKSKSSKEQKDLMIETSSEPLAAEQGPAVLTPDLNGNKVIHNYYLDDAVTEIMYAESSVCSSDLRELFSTSTGSHELEPIQQLQPTSPYGKLERFDEAQETDDVPTTESQSNLLSLQNTPHEEPSTAVKTEEVWKDDPKKLIPIECRKSIDKIYGLMKKLGSADTLDCKSTRSKCTIDSNIKATTGQENSIQCSDSGTSIKHFLASSNLSSVSFDKIPTTENNPKIKSGSNKKSDGVMTVVPKVIISTKQQTNKIESEKNKKERKKVSIRVSENPLKAISQLLHEFDSVQKNRQKLATDSKAQRKAEILPENRNVSRIGVPKNRSRLESFDVSKDDHNDKAKVTIGRERRMRPVGSEPPKGSQQMPHEDRHVSRKKISDIMDEVKEAKGEAVRGPSRFTARLNSLAQPKKSYVQARSEEYQTKYGRGAASDRPPRQLGAATARGRTRRPGEPTPAAPARHQPALSPLERGAKPRRASSVSPVKPAPQDAATYKPTLHTPDAPETQFKNKMVAVESYVKSHYGRTMGADGEARAAANARVPLVPNDIELSPVSSPLLKESTVIGKELHHIVKNILKTKPAKLTALAEGPESCSRHSQDDRFDDDDYQCGIDHPSSGDSDYRSDIFKDKHVETAVQNLLEDRHEETVTDETSECNAFKCDDMETFKSPTELQELENALHRRLSVGAFSKRLRIKNLTITPKQSMQQMFLLQSGDADSVVLHSTVSTSLKLNISQSISEKDFCELQSLSKPQMAWNVTNIPMQITTVGYAFSKYNTTPYEPNCAVKSLHDIMKTDNSDAIKDKIISYPNELPEPIRLQDFDCHKGDITKSETKELNLPSKEDSGTNTVMLTRAAVTNEIAVDTTELNEVKCVKSIDKLQNFSIETKLENTNHTSSLDMLVGLLNEIQKISAYHITNTESCTDHQECKQLEDMFKNNKSLDCTYNAPRELISLTSLYGLRHLDSNPSICSLLLSNDESMGVDGSCFPNVEVFCNDKPTCADKEVSVEFPAKNFTSTLTDVPSLFPITITHSTNVTNSVLGILSQRSSESFFSVSDGTCNDFSDCHNKIIEITEPMKLATATLPSIATVPSTKDVVMKRKIVKHKQTEKAAVIPFSTKTRLLNTTRVAGSDNDPLLKMKRDILVTVYSMLVLTVFAALSFPDLLYYT